MSNDAGELVKAHLEMLLARAEASVEYDRAWLSEAAALKQAEGDAAVIEEIRRSLGLALDVG